MGQPKLLYAISIYLSGRKAPPFQKEKSFPEHIKTKLTTLLPLRYSPGDKLENLMQARSQVGVRGVQPKPPLGGGGVGGGGGGVVR